jgi:ribosomal protein L37AE/L43A
MRGESKRPASETYSHEGPQCPHCGRQYTADDPNFYREDYTDETCDECGKPFKVSVYHSVSWTSTPVDEP